MGNGFFGPTALLVHCNTAVQVGQADTLTSRRSRKRSSLRPADGAMPCSSGIRKKTCTRPSALFRSWRNRTAGRLKPTQD